MSILVSSERPVGSLDYAASVESCLTELRAQPGEAPAGSAVMEKLCMCVHGEQTPGCAM